jgi:hypothetical protein
MNTLFVPAPLLRNWREQRPINQGDLDLRVTGGGGIGILNCTGGELGLFEFLYRITGLLLGCLANDTPVLRI